MFTRKIHLPLILAALLLASCGSDDSKPSASGGASGGGRQESVVTEGYRFDINGCDTKAQSFSAADTAGALALLCEGLQDDSLNRSCAERERKAEFARKECPGTFTPRYGQGGEQASRALAEALSRMEATRDPGELRELAERAIRASQGRPELGAQRARIGRILESRKTMITAHHDEEFQSRFLALVADELGNDGREVLATLCGDILAMGGQPRKQMAAAYLLASEPSRPGLKPFVYGAVGHRLPEVRSRALLALRSPQLLPAREDVPAIARLFKSKDWEVRRAAAALLGRIKGEPSLRALLEQYAVEDDADVRRALQEAIDALK